MNWNYIHLPNLTTSFPEFDIYALDGNSVWQNVGNSANNNYIFPAQTCNSLQQLYVSLEDENGCVSNSSINGAILKDTISPNKPIISDVSVDSNGKSVISWSSSSTDVDVYAIYLLDEFGAWITLDSVYGFNNNTFTYSASNAVNNYETFSIRSIDSCGNASSRSIMHNSMNIISKINICDLSINFNWNEYINFEDGLSHYKIFINTTNLNGDISYDSVRTNNLSFSIENIREGFNYYFYVAAYNGDSSLVAISDQVNYLISLPSQPKYNYIDYVSVDNDNNSVEISCLVDNEAIIDRYLIYRSFENSNSFSEIGSVLYNNSSTINYMDYSARPDQYYYQYKVYPVDTCENILQAPSVYLSIDDTSFGQTIYLNSEINS